MKLALTGHVPPRRVQKTVTAALAALDMSAQLPLLSLPTPALRPSRQVVHAQVSASSGSRQVAIRVALAPDAAGAEQMCWEQRVGRTLSLVGARLHAAGVIQRNPVVGPVHDQPIWVGAHLATVWEFVPGSTARLTAAGWGETLALLHRIGSSAEALGLLAERPRSSLLTGLDADTVLARLADPAHPFHHHTRLVRRWARALRTRAAESLTLDPTPLLAHRDLHPLNCIPTQERGVIAIDWQDAGWGSRSDDFAWLYLLVRRFGGNADHLPAAREAYAAVHGTCPTLEQITAAGHVRELVFLGYSIQNAHLSATHLAECLTELPVLTGPQARTGRWRLLFNPQALEPRLVA